MSSIPEDRPIKKSKRRAVIIGSVVLVSTLVLRECGPLGLDLYGLTSHTTCAFTPHSEAFEFSAYHLIVSEDDRTLAEHFLMSGSIDPPAITAELVTKWGGWSWVPFYKSFSLRFECVLNSGGVERIAEVNGDVNLTVIGPCSARTARACARNMAVDLVADFVMDSATDGR